jgi:YidC/Oxa1 family membrane protein insertase
LPLFIGYVSLTVPAGLALYWLFNNLFTTATQVYLRQGGGAVAKIEKTEDFQIKVPLGCAVVDLTKMQTQARDVAYDGPFVIYGDASGASQASSSGGDGLDIASAAANASGAFYTTPQERAAATEKWANLLKNRGARARNPADRQMASVSELQAVIDEFEAGGMVDEASEIKKTLESLLRLGGDSYSSDLRKRGEAMRAEEEARALREAVGAAEETAGGVPTTEELE